MIIIGVISNKKESGIIKILRKIMVENKLKVSIIETYESNASTPSKMNLKRYVNELDKNGIDIVVVKVISKYILENMYSDISFNILIHESILSEENENVVENSLEEQSKLFQAAGRNCVAIVNSDDENVLAVLQNIKMSVITYGLGSKATITASSISEESQCAVFIYCIQRTIKSFKEHLIEPQEFPVRIPSIERSDIYNALAAVTGAIVCDIEMNEKITSKLEIV